MNKAKLAAVLLALAASPAHAAPVYMHCIFPKLVNQLKVSVDEETAVATVYIPASGYRHVTRANFTSDSVFFSDGVVPWRLSRVDLTVVRGERGSRHEMAGQCEVEQTAKRVF